MVPKDLFSFESLANRHEIQDCSEPSTPSPVTALGDRSWYTVSAFEDGDKVAGYSVWAGDEAHACQKVNYHTDDSPYEALIANQDQDKLAPPVVGALNSIVLTEVIEYNPLPVDTTKSDGQSIHSTLMAS